LAETKATIRTISGMQSAVGWVGKQTITIGRPEGVGGDGLGYSGGQVLVLAVGTCFYNNLYYAADERGINIRSVELEVSSGWTEEPKVSSGIVINAKVEADASPADIEELIHQANHVSTVSNSVRQGTTVSMGSVQIVSKIR
jgi:putative redox protein